MLYEDYCIYSHHLNREMPFRIYGAKGYPVLAYPTSTSKCDEYEKSGLLEPWLPYIKAGYVQLLCVGTIDSETWRNQEDSPSDRIALHERWVHFLIYELLPHLRRTLNDKIFSTGCGLGGFHAFNLFLRWPEYFSGVLAMSPTLAVEHSFGKYSDDYVFINAPLSYLSGMASSHPYAEMYRHRTIILCAGSGESSADTCEAVMRVSQILEERNIHVTTEIWGDDVTESPCGWKKQLKKILPNIFLHSLGDA